MIELLQPTSFKSCIKNRVKNAFFYLNDVVAIRSTGRDGITRVRLPTYTYIKCLIFLRSVYYNFHRCKRVGRERQQIPRFFSLFMGVDAVSADSHDLTLDTKMHDVACTSGETAFDILRPRTRCPKEGEAGPKCEGQKIRKMYVVAFLMKQNISSTPTPTPPRLTLPSSTCTARF